MTVNKNLTMDEYSVLARRTEAPLGTIDRLNHAQLGFATEAGEFATVVKRVKIYGKELTQEMRENAIEELGDLLWYIPIACDALGVTLGEVAAHNIEKLQARFPNKFSAEDAEARADKGGLDARNS